MKANKLIGALALALLLSACGKNASEEHATEERGHEEGGEHAETEEAKKGTHGGRLLEQGGYAVELAIAEDGTPPKYQAWRANEGSLIRRSQNRSRSSQRLCSLLTKSGRSRRPSAWTSSCSESQPSTRSAS